MANDIILFIIQVATTPQVQSQFCPNQSHCHLGTIFDSFIRRMTGDELHNDAERDPVDREQTTIGCVHERGGEPLDLCKLF